jgi:hypothetical protein
MPSYSWNRLAREFFSYLASDLAFGQSLHEAAAGESGLPPGLHTSNCALKPKVNRGRTIKI